MKENLVIKYKSKGRSYKFTGQDLSKSAWYIEDEDGNTFDTYEDYEKAKAPVKKKAVTKKASPVVKSDDK